MGATVSKEINEVEKVAKKAAFSPLMEVLTRIGYGVRGLIYITMGLLAMQFAIGAGGDLAGQQEAIAEIGEQPAGLILLWIILVGLISYSLWGVIRAVLDPLKKGRDLQGLLERFGYLVSAFGYAVLILPTYGYISGFSHDNGSSTRKFISSIMTMPWGPLVLGITGIVIVAGGMYQIYHGLKADFDRQFQLYAMTIDKLKVVKNVGRFGTAARGVVFAIAGGLLSVAAYQVNPSQNVGTETALATLLFQPYGIWLLGIIALGLIAFGLFSILSALWFRLKR